MTITVIGKDSFLANALQLYTKNLSSGTLYRFLDYQEALNDTSWASSSDTVINFAFSPKMHESGYEESSDLDSKLAKYIQEYSDISYVMMSSRKVYGETSAKTPISENAERKPDTPYGKAKAEIESRLQNILGKDRLTILRPANIFGPEIGRRTFFGIALTNLQDNNIITYDFDPQTKKDFISSAYFAKTLHTVLQKPQPGIFNIGSGFSIECEKIAAWLIEGFGSGKLEVTRPVIHDSFELDTRKMYEAYGIKPYSIDLLRSDCLEAGNTIKN